MSRPPVTEEAARPFLPYKTRSIATVCGSAEEHGLTKGRCHAKCHAPGRPAFNRTQPLPSGCRSSALTEVSPLAHRAPQRGDERACVIFAARRVSAL